MVMLELVVQSPVKVNQLYSGKTRDSGTLGDGQDKVRSVDTYALIYSVIYRFTRAECVRSVHTYPVICTVMYRFTRAEFWLGY